jgi:hypothetical protein
MTAAAARAFAFFAKRVRAASVWAGAALVLASVWVFGPVFLNLVFAFISSRLWDEHALSRLDANHPLMSDIASGGPGHRRADVQAFAWIGWSIALRASWTDAEYRSRCSNRDDNRVYPHCNPPG